MKTTEQWQKEILLAESGELPARRLRALEEALAWQPELVAYRNALRRLRAEIREDANTPPVDDSTRHRIMEAATAATSCTAPRMRPFRSAWKPIAIAATLLVLLAGALLRPQHPDQTTELVVLEHVIEMTPEPAEEFVTLTEIDRLLEDLFGPLHEVAWLNYEDQTEEWLHELDMWGDS